MDQDLLVLEPPPSAKENAVALQPRTRKRSASYERAEPPADERLAAALSKLRMLVVRRDDEPINEAAQNIAYIELLLDFPTEIALDVIAQWPRRNKFWPAWLELQEAIEAAIEDDSRPKVVPLERPVRLIVKQGCVAEFAQDAVAAYGRKLRRRMSAEEERTFHRQAMLAAAGQVERIGLDGEETWAVADLRKYMPGFKNFTGRLAGR